jgi:asparagine synthase (glutamine-hydrolysing)
MFASEVKPLLDLIDEEADANLQKAYDYLVFGEYDSNEETFFNNIYQLQPGTGIKISIDNLGRIKIEKRKWWCATKIKPKNITYDDAVRLVRDEFLRSVKLHLRSDVPLGVALSGGLDSSALVCAMRKVAPDLKIHTFSFISEEPSLSEEIWVDKVNTYVSAESHKVKPSSYELGKDLITMIDTQGEPFGSTSIYAQFRVFQLAKEHGITVTLDGQGADELLGGYDGYPEQILRGYFKRFQFIKFLKFLIEWSKWPGRNISLGVLKFIQATIPDSLYGFLRDKSGKQRTPSWLVLEEFKRKNIQLEENRRNNTDGSEGVLTSYLKKFLGKRSLPSLLRHADRNSMNFSIESRVPFLTIPLAELMLSLKDSYLVSEEGQTKNIFRDAMKGIVPEDVLFRRDKVGFVTSEHLWMSQLSSEIEEWIASAENIPFICSKELKKNFSLLFQGKREFDWQFWRWINYIVWYDRFILKNKKD